MCTVTIVPLQDGFRLGCNRDERRDRAEARPPAVHGLQHRTAVFPVDPQGLGTWVGVNDAGLAGALLNRTIDSAEPIVKTSRLSRGLIIPDLLDCTSLTEALDVSAALDPGDFDRFRLVVAQNTSAAIVMSDGVALSVELTKLSRPIMLTSSSLGDAFVEGPRRRLFDRLFAGEARSWLRAQSRFHSHQWPSRRDISVRMERADARTVSQTIVNVSCRAIELRYRAPESTKSVVVAVVQSSSASSRRDDRNRGRTPALCRNPPSSDGS